MKFIYLLCILVYAFQVPLIVLFLQGKNAQIVFPFAASDVERIETYYDDGISERKEKTIEAEEAIDHLYNLFSERSFEKEELRCADSFCALKMVFFLADGTGYEVAYAPITVKTGYLRFGSDDSCYLTSSDIVGAWESLAGTSY